MSFLSPHSCVCLWTCVCSASTFLLSAVPAPHMFRSTGQDSLQANHCRRHLSTAHPQRMWDALLETLLKYLLTLLQLEQNGLSIVRNKCSYTVELKSTNHGFQCDLDSILSIPMMMLMVPLPPVIQGPLQAGLYVHSVSSLALSLLFPAAAKKAYFDQIILSNLLWCALTCAFLI